MTRIISCQHHPKRTICDKCQLFNAVQSLGETIDRRDLPLLYAAPRHGA